jgi:hypothetical protein
VRVAKQSTRPQLIVWLWTFHRRLLNGSSNCSLTLLFLLTHSHHKVTRKLISSSSSSSSNTADMMSTHTNEAPQSSFVHGPFRVLRTLGVGGYAKAVAAQDIPSNHLMCIKVFQKHNLKHKHTALSVSKELRVCQRLASAMPCPATQSIEVSSVRYSVQENNDGQRQTC